MNETQPTPSGQVSSVSPTATAPNEATKLRQPSIDPSAYEADRKRAKIAQRMRIGAEALPTRVPWGFVVLFTGIAYLAGWAVCLPFWLNGGLESLGPVAFQVLLAALMFTPTLATIVVVLVQRPKHPFSLLGLRGRPVGRTLLFCAIAWLAPPVLFFGGVLVAGALGFATLDLTGEAFRGTYLSNLAAMGTPAETVAEFEALPPVAIFGIVAAYTTFASVALSSITAFGEELGWRGWLLPHLRPLGTWPAILISGAIWGLWHAPIILLGYNFQDRGPLGLLLMIGFCVSVGTFCSWVRLRSATVYPAAIAHGSINAWAGTVAAFVIPDLSVVDPKVALVGWTSWVPFLLLAVVLVALGQFAKQPLPGLTLAESALALQGRTTDADADAGAGAVAAHGAVAGRPDTATAAAPAEQATPTPSRVS